jgi:hypothetical protein
MNNFSEQKIINFPDTVNVTEQVILTKDFSSEWKDNVAELARHILGEYKKEGKERFIVALGGPSGSSKSTTSAVLQEIIEAFQSKVPVIVVGQDGYHFAQEYLLKTCDENNEPLAKHKGRYDSFDCMAIKKDLESFVKGVKVSFPLYSRKIHDPIANAILCKDGPCLMIFEGLWVLYNEKPWNELLSLYDYSIFIHAPADVRKLNTITRHVRGNEHSLTDAENFYNRSDAKNAELIDANISHHDYDFYYTS